MIPSTRSGDAAPDVDIGAPDPGAASRPVAGLRERHAAETRAAIVGAARSLIDAHGFTDTTVERIAERAGVSERTVFRYFPTKEALLFAGFDQLRGVTIARLEERPLDEHPLRSLVQVLCEIAPLTGDVDGDLQWGLRIASDEEVVLPHEQSSMKTKLTEDLVAFIARRLGTSVEDDPRPGAWAVSVTAMFGSVLRVAVHGSVEVDLVAAFRELLAESSAGLAAAVDEPR